MNIIPLVVGSLSTNCYLVTSGQDCVIIDPGDDADFISTSIIEHKLHPLAILLTHGHFDHCLAALELKLNFNLPIYLHPKDIFLYQSADKSASHWTGVKSLKTPPPDKALSDHQNLSFGDLSIDVIHTPGHTPGSVCFKANNHLFTGDLLFDTGVGRTDFSYSSRSDLLSSLNKIGRLPSSTLFYPGHEGYGSSLDEALSPHTFRSN